MRKCLAALSAVFILIFCFAGCDSNSNKAGFEPLVTLEQVNSDSKFAARAYLESLFLDNRPLFEACYPEGFLDRLGESAGVDIYAEYRKLFNMNGQFLGTSYADGRNYSIENGLDEAYMRSRICSVTGLEYSDVGLVRIEKIMVYFDYEQMVASDFYIVTYEAGGRWYVLESITGKVEF